MNYNKNNNIYNTNNYIQKPKNISNTNNNIFQMNIQNYNKNNNIYNTTQDPITLGSDSGPNAHGSCIKTYFAWVLREDPKEMGTAVGPKNVGS